MRQVWRVFKFEFTRRVLRVSFLLILILIPVLPFGILFLFSMIEGDHREIAPAPVMELIEGVEETKPEGFVDLSGLIQTQPKGTESTLLRMDSEEAGRRALEQEQISALYILSANYMESGRITTIRPDFNLFNAVRQSRALDEVIRYNLLRDHPRLYARLENPFNLQYNLLKQTRASDLLDVTSYILPYGVAMLFFVTIYSSSSLLLDSVTLEKQSRVLEILMTSIEPVQMLAGKTGALGLIGLLQFGVWSAAGYGLLSLLGQDSAFIFPLIIPPTELIAWGLLYFILGFSLYASLMAGVGALVSNLREASQVTFIIILPILAPAVLLFSLVARPNGAAAVFLSLFPLTSPTAMPMRLAVEAPPLWQILLSLGLLAGAVVLVVRSAARMFRAQTLLSGQPFKLRLFFRAMAGKV